MRRLPEDSIQIATNPMKSTFFRWISLIVLIPLAGCAKFPGSGFSSFTKRLVLTVRIEGTVQFGQNGTQYIYVIPLRLSKDLNPIDGPKPVLSGIGSQNGIVTGACTDYILCDLSNPNPYQIYHFQDTTLTAATLVGFANAKTSSGSTLSCEIDLSQVVPLSDVDLIQTVQANFFAMDKRALGGGSHSFDALGNSRSSSEINRFLQFDLRSSRKITNTQTQIEPPNNDVNGGDNPDLNFIDWSVEILLQQ